MCGAKTEERVPQALTRMRTGPRLCCWLSCGKGGWDGLSPGGVCVWVRVCDLLYEGQG